MLEKKRLKGLFAWREEDPRRLNNFTLGLHAEISVRVVSKKRRFSTELKMARDKNKNAIWAPLPSLLGSSNPDPISGQKISFSTASF